MRFDVCSDFHLDFFPEMPGFGPVIDSVFPESCATTLLVAGDLFPNIGVPDARVERFFKAAEERYERIFVVLGNHDYWSTTLSDAPDEARKAYGRFSKVRILQDETVELDEKTLLFGSTLWSRVPVTDELFIEGFMRDYQWILREDRENLIHVSDTTAAFESSWIKARAALASNPGKRFVFLTHHSPSRCRALTGLRKESWYRSNCAYHNDLEGFVFDHPEIRLWVHGHTHSEMDYRIGQCQVLCHPCGYYGRSWELSENYKVKSAEIDD